MGNLEIDYYNEIGYINKSSAGNSERVMMQRQNLYRHCGIPIATFNQSEILEAGPAAGETTKIFLKWGCKHIDLLEPADLSRKYLRKNLLKAGYTEENFKIYSDMVENYETNKKYDLIFAEGFMQFVPNPKAAVDNMMRMSHNHSIIVLSCVDEVSIFVESMKRLIAKQMTSKDINLKTKVENLVPIFEKQLNQLAGCSRGAEEWIYDNIFQPQKTKLFSIEDALECFSSQWKVQGCSPRFLPEYSFWKDLGFSEREEVIKQFEKKRHMLLWTGMRDSILSSDQYALMMTSIRKIRDCAMQYESIGKIDCIKEIVSNLEKLEKLFMDIDCNMSKIFRQIIQIFSSKSFLEAKIFKIEEFCDFYYAFGRGQQYLAMVRTEW